MKKATNQGYKKATIFEGATARHTTRKCSVAGCTASFEFFAYSTNQFGGKDPSGRRPVCEQHAEVKQ